MTDPARVRDPGDWEAKGKVCARDVSLIPVCCSKSALEGDGNSAGDVFDRDREDLAAELPAFAAPGGKRYKAGEAFEAALFFGGGALS